MSFYLSSHDRRVLKALGQKMKDDAVIGKAGLCSAFIEHVSHLFRRRELVKLRFSDVSGDSRVALASEIAGAFEAVCVAVVGRTLLLYKPNPMLDADQRALKQVDEESLALATQPDQALRS